MKLSKAFICIAGRIVEYFPATQTATIKLSNDRTFSTPVEDEVQVKEPLLYDVPVYTSGGGTWHTTFPIKVGDTCLMHFSQSGYDHWLFKDADGAGVDTDGKAMPWTKRMFSCTDGFAQVGWNNIPRAIPEYSATDAEFRNQDRNQRVTLLENGQIHIKTGTTTINLKPDGDIDINTDANLNATVGGNMTSTVTGNSVVTCETAEVTANTSSTVTSPAIDMNAATGVTMTTPLCTITGNLLLGGALGSGGAAVPASGAVITGPLESTDTVTATNVISGGKSVNGHSHTNPEGGTTGPF